MQCVWWYCVRARGIVFSVCVWPTRVVARRCTEEAVRSGAAVHVPVHAHKHTHTRADPSTADRNHSAAIVKLLLLLLRGERAGRCNKYWAKNRVSLHASGMQHNRGGVCVSVCVSVPMRCAIDEAYNHGCTGPPLFAARCRGAARQQQEGDGGLVQFS